MSEVESAKSLKTWIESQPREECTFTVSLTRDGELVSLSKIQGRSENRTEDELLLDPCFDNDGESTPETLYRYRLPTGTQQTESSTGHIETWHRYAYEIEGVRDSDGNETRAAFKDVNYRLEIETRGDTSDSLPSTDHVKISDIEQDTKSKSLRATRVAGLDSQKEELREFLTQTPEKWGLEAQTGIMLEGPPGTGKTELVIEVCRELYGEVPVTISGPEILSRWVGESERILRDRFEEARGRNNPVLYIDELDAIARARSDVSQEYSAQIVAQLLVLLDGINSKRRRTTSGDGEDTDTHPVKVIASTNLAEVVDPALKRPGRLGDQPIVFDRPSDEECLAIVHHYLEQVRREAKLGEKLTQFVKGSDCFPEHISQGLDGLTGAGIEQTVRKAVKNAQDDRSDALEWEHLEDATNAIHGVNSDNEQKLSDTQLAAIHDAKLVFGGSVRNQIDEPTLKKLSEEYANRTDSYRAAVDLSNMLTGGSETLSRRLEKINQEADGAAVCLYIKNASEILDAARHGLPFAEQTVQTLLRELFVRSDDDVAFLSADPESMNTLFPPELYYQL